MRRSFMDGQAMGELSANQTGNIEFVLLPVDKSLVGGEKLETLLQEALSAYET
jgi:hypothetical protein